MVNRVRHDKPNLGARAPAKVARNAPCACGSGEKAKACHLAPPPPETVNGPKLRALAADLARSVKDPLKRAAMVDLCLALGDGLEATGAEHIRSCWERYRLARERIERLGMGLTGLAETAALSLVEKHKRLP